MPRPSKCRRVCFQPGVRYFKPQAIPLSELKEVALKMDEIEAVRLADYEGLYQEDAAKKMNISRQTFGNIIISAHEKIADFLINGKALKIEGGVYKMTELRIFECSDCSHGWKLSHGTGRPAECPKCKGNNIHRADGKTEICHEKEKCKRRKKI